MGVDRQSDGYTLTISGTGAMQDWTDGSAPWFAFNDYINTVVVEDGVKSIGQSAFLR